jgi:hypothetical protein
MTMITLTGAGFGTVGGIWEGPTTPLPDSGDFPILWTRADTSVLTGGARQYTKANSEYHSRADNTFFSAGDIPMYGCCFARFDTIPTTVFHERRLFGQYDYGNANRSYAIQYSRDSLAITCVLSDNGTNTVSVSATTFGDLSTNVWYFVEWWHDEVADTITVAVNQIADSVAHTTGLFDSAAPFAVGIIFNNGVPEAAANLAMDGRIARVILAKNAAARAIIDDATLRTWLFNLKNGRVAGEVAAHATLGPFLDGVQMDMWTGICGPTLA